MKYLAILLQFFALLVFSYAHSTGFASEPVVNYIARSLNNWTIVNDVLEVNGQSNVRLSETGLFSMIGNLENIKLEGLSQGVRNLNVVFNDSSLTMEGQESFEYSFDIEMAKITGDYNLTGSVGSAIPVTNQGQFEAQLARTIKVYCDVIVFSKNGFLKQDRCFVYGLTLSAEEASIDFKGLAESSNSSRLDSLLVQDIYERILDNSVTYGSLRSLIGDAIFGSSFAYIQQDLDKKKLLDIMSETNLEYSNVGQLENIDNFNELSSSLKATASSALKDRIKLFLESALQEFGMTHNDPTPLNGSLFFDKKRSVLFPVNATFKNVEYSGLSRLSDISGELISNYGGAELGIQFNITDLGLKGVYIMEGGIADDIPINSTGLFEFGFVGQCKVVAHGQGENQNGKLVWLRNTMSYMDCSASEHLVSFSPSPLEGTGIEANVAEVIMDSVGVSMNGVIEYYLREPIIQEVIGYLQSKFNVVPVIDIITL